MTTYVVSMRSSTSMSVVAGPFLTGNYAANFIEKHRAHCKGFTYGVCELMPPKTFTFMKEADNADEERATS